MLGCVSLLYEQALVKFMTIFLFVCFQMIESSAHGDEYDGVIFSQLVR